MTAPEILDALRDLTARSQFDFLPLAPETVPLSPYPPIHKYLLDLKNAAKPESAAEDLFVALCMDILEVAPTRHVCVAEGYVDFMLPERTGEPIPLELKLLFKRDGDSLLRGETHI